MLKVTEIDDVMFRQAIFKGLNKKNTGRRFQIHFSDLLYSLIISYYRKLFPQKFSDNAYFMIQHWMRGIGHEIGSVRMLKHANIVYQKRTQVGKAIGSIDLILNGIIYEITTTRYLSQKREMPFEAKLEQLIWYMASERANNGRVKIFDLMIPKRSRTWEVHLSDADITMYRNRIESLSYSLNTALLTGDWTKLPRTDRAWRIAPEKDIIEWLEARPKTVRYAHRRWMDAKERWKQNCYIDYLSRGSLLRRSSFSS